MQSATQLPPYRWTILAITWASYLVVFMARLSVGPLAPFLKQEFTLSNAEIGSLVGASALLHIPTLMSGGWLVDRFGERRMFVAGTGIATACGVALFFANSYHTMLVIMLIAGIGSGCIPPAVTKALVLWFPARERATAMGLNQTSVNSAGILGAALLPTIAILLGWRYALLTLGVLSLAACVANGILYRAPPDVAPAAKAISGSSLPRARRSFRDVLVSRDIWMVAAYGFFLAGVEFTVMAHLVTYLKERLMIAAVTAGAILAMSEAAGVLAKPVSGLISDRLLNGRRKTVIVIMAALTGLSVLTMGLGGNSLGWVLYPTIALLGAMAIGWAGMCGTLLAELAGAELAGAAYGAATGIWGIGIMTTPPLFGYIVDRTGSFQIAWLVMALFAGIGLVAALLIREHKRLI